jgi:hypothetical protein
MTRIGLIRSIWISGSSIRFGFRSPRLPLEFDAGSSTLETQVAP